MKVNPAVLWIGIALAVAVAAGTGAWFGGFFDRSADPSAQSAGAANPDAAIDPDARPPEWFASYKDKFLSVEVIRYTSAKAEMRNFPTAKGTMSLQTLEPGTMLVGRLVEGGDADSKWLKTGEGGYVWTGNLAERPTIAPPADGTMPLAVSNVRLGRRVIDGQVGDFVSDGVFRQVPAEVLVQFDYSGVTPGQAYTCGVRDMNGAVMPSKQATGHFQTEFGFIWCSFAGFAPGTYDLIVTSQGAMTWLAAFRVVDIAQDAASAAAAAAATR